MTESELAMKKELIKLEYKEPEHRPLMPFKTTQGVWAILCLKCAEKPNEELEK